MKTEIKCERTDRGPGQSPGTCTGTYQIVNEQDIYAGTDKIHRVYYKCDVCGDPTDRAVIVEPVRVGGR